MALSNIFREPRREITESVLGTLAILGLFFADYRFGRWCQNWLEANTGHQPGYWNGIFIVGMLGGAMAVVLAYPVLFLFPHFIGEMVCDLLSVAGLELRPRNRR